MRIVCPNCAATYEVPDDLLAARRPVRCARCGGEWTPEPAPPSSPSDAVAAPGIVAAPEPPPTPAAPSDDVWAPRTADAAGATRAETGVLERPSATESPSLVAEGPIASPPASPRPPSRRARIAGWIGWGISLLVLVALGWAAYAWRTPLMHAWPPSERIYALLGLA